MKNASNIFQAAMQEGLMSGLGLGCMLYAVNVVVFGKDEQGFNSAAELNVSE